MTPKWLFVEDDSSSGAGANIQVDATLVATAQAARYNLSSWSKSGSDTSDWEEYTYRPVRKTSTFVLFIVGLTSGSQWANVGDFQSSTTNYTGEITIGGTTLSHTSISIYGSASSANVQVRFYAPSTEVTSFWNGVAAGQSFLFKLSYQGT